MPQCAQNSHRIEEDGAQNQEKYLHNFLNFSAEFVRRVYKMSECLFCFQK